jgi:hypothetical protein
MCFSSRRIREFVWSEMLNHRRKLVVCAVLLAGFHMAVLFAGFFAPYGYAAQNRELPFTPPTRPHFIDSHGRFHVRPFVYGWQSDAAVSGPVFCLRACISLESTSPAGFLFLAPTDSGAINFRVFFTAARCLFWRVCSPPRCRWRLAS